MRERITASEKSLIVFQDEKIRKLWHDAEWFYSASDIMGILTDSKDELAYWRKLKQRKHQLVTICHNLKMPTKDVLIKPCEKNLNAIIINNVYKSQVVNTNA
ncbi:MAG: hypothetical protein L6282_01080 [Candidatus Methanoperedenaceae archaeon]|nr:hypothetical protein [Candidatus Methanoperedenaceae archaeon]